MGINEQEFISGLKNKDGEVFERIFKHFYPKLFVFAQSMLHDSAISDDIVQEVFCNLWDKATSINITSSLSSYLYRSVRNATINYIKSHQKKDDFIDDYRYKLQQKELNHFNNESASKHLVSGELKAQIQNTINELPEQCQRIFKMSRNFGYKNREIASELGISIKAVEKHISKALKTLRSEIEEILYISIFINIFF